MSDHGTRNGGNARLWSGPLRKALVLEHPDPVLDVELGKLGIEVHRVDEPPDEDELVRLMEAGQYNLIFKRSRIPITERVVAASDNLAAVMLCCIGHDSVDLEACASRGVMVMNDPVSNGRSVAEMVLGEIICLSRRIFDSVIEMRESIWKKNNKERFEVAGKRIGILGLGNIGRQVAQLAEMLDMRVVFYDSAVVPREVGLAMGWEAADSIEDLFRACDFVTAHVSATDYRGRSNKDVITYEALRAMSDKPSRSGPRIFLNLARGVIVDPADLRRAVEEGHITHAITDVFPEEPAKSKATGAAWVNPYVGEPRIFATPHIGAATQEAQPRIAHYMSRTTQLFSNYGMVRNCVFKPRATIEFKEPGAASILAVVHADTRGTKKAVDDAIYNAGVSNLQSSHVDFPELGIAYDLSALDRELTDEQCDELVSYACQLTGDERAIRWVRRIPLSD